MTTYLLDTDVLIAQSIAEHEHGQRVRRWSQGVVNFALCPVVEGALVRYLVRVGQDRQSITELLAALAARPGYSFWPDHVPYRQVNLTGITGHRQVTDAYLVALVQAHPGARLATLDEDLVQNHPDLATLVP